MKNIIIGFFVGSFLGFVVLFLIIQPHKKRERISMLVYGLDTFVITGTHNINYKLAKGHWMHGWVDDSTGVLYRGFEQPDTADTFINSGEGQQLNNTGSGSQVIINK